MTSRMGRTRVKPVKRSFMRAIMERGVGHLWSDPLRKLFTISLLKLQRFEQPARERNRTRAVTTIGEIPSGRIETFIVLLALILTFVGRAKLELGDPE